MSYRANDLSLDISEESNGTRLRAAFHKRGHHLEADVLVERPRAHETLNVVIPWSDTSFQFTSKQNTRPANGSATFDGRTFPFHHGNRAFGCLDFGRGAWPYHTVWNWGAAAGWQDGRLIGLNLGGKWTDGTGMTENGICVDGRLHKVGEPLVWTYDVRNFRQPWRIVAPRTKRVDLTFVAEREETQRVELGIVGTDLHWLLGHYNGTVVTDNGVQLEIRDLLGWAEEHVARW
jgi:hypothetical protein